MARQGPEGAPLLSAPSAPRWSEFVALLAVAVLLLGLLFGRLFVDPFFYFSTDNAELYFAWLVMLRRALHHGSWPFLNPYAFAGSLPFAPLESGALYPVTLLTAILASAAGSLDSFYLVFLGLSFLHYLLGACFMYALLRRIFALGSTASMVGALCYAFGGSFLGRFSHQPVLYALAWLPLAVSGAMAFVKVGAPRSGALAIAALWLMGVASHPQVFLYGFAVVTGAVVWFGLTEDRTLRWGALRRGAIVLALALGFLGPRLLPLVELSRVTVRPASAYTIANLFDSLSPLYYLTLLAPGVFGRHILGYWGTDHPLGNWGCLLYIGVLPVLSACFSVLHRRRRDWGFAVLGAGVTCFLLLGRHWAVSAWVNQHLPLSDALTDLSKLTIALHFFLALLAALGVDALLTGGRPRLVTVMALVWGGSVITLLMSLSPELISTLAPAGRRAPSAEAVRFAVESVRQARALALLALAALLAVIAAPRWAKALFVPVLVADLALSLGPYNPIEASKGDPAIYYGGDAGTRHMQRDPDTFRVASLAPPNGGIVLALESVWGYHTVVTSAYASIQGFFDVHDRRNRQMYNLANIKYQRENGDLSSHDFTRVAPGLWLNRAALPRAHFVGRCRGFSDTMAMTSHARASSFDSSRELMLFEPDCRQVTQGRGSCRLQSVAEDRQRYSAECSVEGGSGWAFFSVVQYPGWTAAVDGAAARLVPADIAFYAVPLDAGRHRVDLVYRPRGLIHGLWIAAGTGILALGLAAWQARRPRADATSTALRRSRHDPRVQRSTGGRQG